MDLRPYDAVDRDGCLAVIDSNTPELSQSNVRRDFEQFIDSDDRALFVMVHEKAIVGCGGYVIAPEKNRAQLLWGTVRSDSQRLGLGRYLLLFRLREIAKAGGIQVVLAEVPHSAVAFYEKQGFKAIRAHEGHVEMIKKLDVCP